MDICRLKIMGWANIEAISKKGFWFKVEAEPRFHAKPDDASILIFKDAPQTAGILKYFEDFRPTNKIKFDGSSSYAGKRGTNKEIGPKDFPSLTG